MFEQTPIEVPYRETKAYERAAKIAELQNMLQSKLTKQNRHLWDGGIWTLNAN